MGRCLALGVVLALFAGTSLVRADDASRLVLAREVVKTTRSAENMRKIMPLMVNQMRMLLKQQGQNDAKTVDSFVQRFQERMSSETESFVDLAAEVYAQEFSEDDLRNLIAFYRTPTGAKIVDKQPDIAQAMIVAGQTWGRNIAQEVVADMNRDRKAASPKL